MSDEFHDLRGAIEAVEYEIADLFGPGRIGQDDEIPDDLRAKLMTMAGSLRDFTFWVRRKPQEDDIGDSQMYYAEEMEAGTGAWGVTAREALDNYFRSDVLDHPRAPPPSAL